MYLVADIEFMAKNYEFGSLLFTPLESPRAFRPPLKFTLPSSACYRSVVNFENTQKVPSVFTVGIVSKGRGNMGFPT
jgi:hypothetical protein